VGGTKKKFIFFSPNFGLGRGGGGLCQNELSGYESVQHKDFLDLPLISRRFLISIFVFESQQQYKEIGRRVESCKYSG